MREATFLIGRRFISARIFSRADIEFAAKLSWKAISARVLLDQSCSSYDSVRDMNTFSVLVSGGRIWSYPGGYSSNVW
jgi:hypothetical protein